MGDHPFGEGGGTGDEGGGGEGEKRSLSHPPGDSSLCIREPYPAGRDSVPARFPEVDGCCIGICRGRPACRPVGRSRKKACPGGHIGPPLRDMGWCSGTNGNWRRTGPPPAGRDGARPLQGAEQPGGGVRLGCGFRQPNFVPKFGAAGCGHPGLRKQRWQCAATGRCT